MAPTPPPVPKPPTIAEQLKAQLQDLDMIMEAKQRDHSQAMQKLMAQRVELMDHCLWAEMNPGIDQKMQFIWDHLKPKS
jgi:hypothetical protein